MTEHDLLAAAPAILGPDDPPPGGRVAIVHDYLTQYGGAERVVLRLAQLFPEAPIYTSLYHQQGTFPEFADLDVRTSWLQGRIRIDTFRRHFYAFPLAFRSFDLSEYDTVVVSSSAFAHHVRHPNKFVYCYTPPRFLWEPDAYFADWRRHVVSGVLTPLRRLDKSAARSATSYVGISATSASKIEHSYGRRVSTIFPPIETNHLPDTVTPVPHRPNALVVSRLLPYKRIDVAISACHELGVPLTIVGHGPESANLQELAKGKDVEFKSRVSDAELADLFAAASLVLVPGIEDFGYIPVESNYVGRPVVAIKAGGPAETVVDGVNGRHVADHSVDNWAQAIKETLAAEWDADELRNHAMAYHADVFARAVREWVGSRVPR